MDNLTLAKKAALAAGEVILSYYAKAGAQLHIEQKSADIRDKVTQADLAANNVIVKMLYNEGPKAGILTEEKLDTDDRELANRMADPFSYRTFWCVDPIDGTLHFINKTGDFGVHIALVEDEKVILGVTYLPVHGNMYWSDGKNAYKDNRIIHCSDRADFAGARFVDSTHYPEPSMHVFKEQGVNISFPGSTGYKCGLIADGKVDAFVKTTPGLSLWDVASSIPLIMASGGKVTDKLGNALDVRRMDVPNGFVVASPILHEKIIEFLTWKKEEIHKKP